MIVVSVYYIDTLGHLSRNDGLCRYNHLILLIYSNMYSVTSDVRDKPGKAAGGGEVMELLYS